MRIINVLQSVLKDKNLAFTAGVIDEDFMKIKMWIKLRNIKHKRFEDIGSKENF